MVSGDSILDIGETRPPLGFRSLDREIAAAQIDMRGQAASGGTCANIDISRKIWTWRCRFFRHSKSKKGKGQ